MKTITYNECQYIGNEVERRLRDRIDDVRGIRRTINWIDIARHPQQYYGKPPIAEVTLTYWDLRGFHPECIPPKYLKRIATANNARSKIWGVFNTAASTDRFTAKHMKAITTLAINEQGRFNTATKAGMVSVETQVMHEDALHQKEPGTYGGERRVLRDAFYQEVVDALWKDCQEDDMCRRSREAKPRTLLQAVKDIKRNAAELEISPSGIVAKSIRKKCETLLPQRRIKPSEYPTLEEITVLDDDWEEVTVTDPKERKSLSLFCAPGRPYHEVDYDLYSPALEKKLKAVGNKYEILYPEDDEPPYL